MNSLKPAHKLLPSALALWGGVECTISRIDDAYISQLERSGHHAREGDIDLFAATGVTALRYPILWEQIAPDGLDRANWSWADARLAKLRDSAIRPIIGLTHHGSGPRYTNLLDPMYPAHLAEYAGAVAGRYPWIDDYTPVNEPLTTARFSCLYGYWHPQRKTDGEFLRALINQCRGIVLSMEAIRAVNPAARLIQTEDLGKTYGTDVMASTVAFYNDRRWLSWDLLLGRVDDRHPLWRYLREGGVADEDLLWFKDRRCSPDLLGINYYVTSDRWLDQRTEMYPLHLKGNGRFVDIEACRVMDKPPSDVGALLHEAWARYGIPIVIAECHLAASRENQMRWLYEVWRASEAVQRQGVDVRAVCVWSLLGAFDWNSLLTQHSTYYESGAFDVTGGSPRPTALLRLMTDLSQGKSPSHPALPGLGWWRRDSRVDHPIEPNRTCEFIEEQTKAHCRDGQPRGPIWVVGDKLRTAALERLCEQRDLECVSLPTKSKSRPRLESDDPSKSAQLPWAIVYFPSNVRQADAGFGLMESTAAAAAQLGIPLLVLYGATNAPLSAARNADHKHVIWFRCTGIKDDITEAEHNAGLDLLIDGATGCWCIAENGHGIRDIAL